MNSLLILYGSQTGNAEEIAKTLVKRLNSIVPSLDISLMSMLQYISAHKITDLASEPYIVIICSTTGNGDAPDNANKFWRKLKLSAKNGKWLEGTQYALLGLGDTNYDQFCAMGKQIDKRMQRYGATEFHSAGFADDGIGLEIVVEPWMSGVVGRIAELQLETNPTKLEEKRTKIPTKPLRTKSKTYCAKFGIQFSAPGTVSPRAKCNTNPREDLIFQGIVPEAPFNCKIQSAQFLTSKEAPKQVVEAILSIPEHAIVNYSPGDCIGIYSRNKSRVVDELINILYSRLNLSLTSESVLTISAINPADALPAHIPAQITLWELFGRCLDITAIPKKVFLKSVSAYCAESERKDLLAIAKNKDLYAEFIENYEGFLGLLQKFPSLAPPLEFLVQEMPPLLPRYYSIASSPLKEPLQMRIAFSAINGVCTSYLVSQCVSAGFLQRDDVISRNLYLDNGESTELSVFLRRTQEFLLPDTGDLILVGPGTGIAPFRGFLEHIECERECQCKSEGVGVGYWRGMSLGVSEGEYSEENDKYVAFPYALLTHYRSDRTVAVYAGFRRRDWDFLYESEFTRWVSKKICTLHIALSRDREKQYVQDKLWETRSRVFETIVTRKGYLYVCGDGAYMAKDVMKTVEKILVEFGFEEALATAYIAEMMREKRYVQDIWS